MMIMHLSLLQVFRDRKFVSFFGFCLSNGKFNKFSMPVHNKVRDLYSLSNIIRMVKQEQDNRAT
jgi:hypothetical protein